MRRFIKGQFDVALVMPMLIGLLYAATGGWTAERWNGALAIMGLGAAAKGGYERGYQTYNPELHRLDMPPPDGTPRDSKGRFTKRDGDVD